MVTGIKQSLKKRLISTIKGQQALRGKKGAYISLSTIYKILKAETTSEKAQVRGILNRDYLEGQILFERAPVKKGSNRSGAYRLKAVKVR